MDQKLLTWIRLIMICYIVPWWPSWLSDQIASSNPESDVVWRVSRLLPWPQSWIFEMNDLAIQNLHDTPMPPIMEMSKMWKVTDGHMDDRRTLVNRPWHNLTWSKGSRWANNWRASRWLLWLPSWILQQKDFNNSEYPCCPNCLSSSFSSI